MKAKEKVIPESAEVLKEPEIAEFERNVAGVRRGATEDARVFLEICATYLTWGDELLPSPYAAFLATRLFEMASAKNPFDEPLLQRHRGQKGADQYERNLSIAREVFNEVKSGHSIAAAARTVEGRRMERFEQQDASRKDKIVLVAAKSAEGLYRKHKNTLEREERLARARALLPKWQADAGKGLTPANIARLLRRATRGEGAE